MSECQARHQVQVGSPAMPVSERGHTWIGESNSSTRIAALRK